MSYPGRISGGKKPIVRAGTKKDLESYFANRFPLADLWRHPKTVVRKYDMWHAQRCREIGRLLRPQLATPGNKPKAVASKFLNTYMHQLIKYEELRPLWEALHLPLDARICRGLRRLESAALAMIRRELSISPYQLTYI